jgi:NAD(P)H-dependent flavin oxidoreductase YrpB (nitropropane dioxygenase family)
MLSVPHAAGVKVVHQVGSVREAQRAAAAGVDVIIAQGVEAGGHVAGEVSTLALVPRVMDAVAPRPVAAAGGIADARGVIAVLAPGAQAAVLGTRFLAITESSAHPHYNKLLAANEGDTVRTILFGYGRPNAPHRTLRTAFVQQWLGQEARGQESSRWLSQANIAARIKELRDKGEEECNMTRRQLMDFYVEVIETAVGGHRQALPAVPSVRRYRY